MEVEIKAVYEASLTGCVSTLNSIIQRDPLILSRISLSPCTETPLHIASLLGHLEFCRILLTKKPSLANETDSEGRFPLHLASAEGHTEVVKELLDANSDICLALDKDDRIPLHLAVMRGRVGVIEKLIAARPDFIKVKLEDGSVLHLCVRYNHLDALRLLVESVSGDKQFLVAQDKKGNTVLHLPVMFRQIKIHCGVTMQTIKYLLSLPEIRAQANVLNRMSLTAFDLLERCPRDFMSLKIQDILIAAGVRRSADIINTPPSPSSPRPLSPPVYVASESETSGSSSRTERKWERFWAKYLQYQGNWIEDTRGTLMVVATVIATMTFQSAVSPPGGVWQENTIRDGFNCTKYTICEAGTAVLAYGWPHDFFKFMTFNTISFFSSLVVVLLLISGFPLKNEVIMWILTIAMSITVTFMGLTYMWALGLVTPQHILHRVYGMGHRLAGAWGAIIFAVALIHAIRISYWVKKRKKKRLHRSRDMSLRISPLNQNQLA